MIIWFPARKQALASAVETFCRFSTKRTLTGGRSVPPVPFKTKIFNSQSEHQSVFIQVHVSSFDHSLCSHVFSPQACHIEGGSAGLIPSQLLEEKRKAFVKRDLELATTGTPLSGTQQSGEALLIMQIGHRLLAAQTHWQQRPHLFLSISYKHFTWRLAALPSSVC